MNAHSDQGQIRAAILILLAATVAGAVAEAPSDHLTDLTAVLGVAAVVAGVGVASARAESSISGSFIVALLAAAFLGPATACALCILAELVASVRRRTRAQLTLVNLTASTAPTLLGANVIRWLEPANRNALAFYAAVLVGGLVLLTASFALVTEYSRRAMDGQWSPQAVVEYAPSVAVNLILAVSGAALYVKLGIAGIAFALTAVAAFAYMAQLVGTARRRSQEYVSLSWGVLAGLLRALDTRDGRAARHAAAVARFSADIARAVGMDAREVELAHTAGLLHDIGHFALSDRVAERGRTLTDEDWEAIHRHPELGADMLRDLGMYGPVAEIVRAHHERLDGLGYPDGRGADEIPEIAKIIAVAEAYDTLTASDSYRTSVSSFEALTELHRHAGAQFDPRYVTVLGELLGGEGARYRHADDADFDTELAMERRITEAAS